MSAKRRTTALASGVLSRAAIASARRGLELPATSLIAPFVAAIYASPAGPARRDADLRAGHPSMGRGRGRKGRSPDRGFRENANKAKAQRGWSYQLRDSAGNTALLAIRGYAPAYPPGPRGQDRGLGRGTGGGR